MMVRRSQSDKVIGGVCAGLARNLGMQPSTMRWIFVLLVLVAGMSAFVYLIGWIFIPSE